VSDKADAMTRAVRAGLESDDVTGAVVPPIHLSSTYAFRGYGEIGVAPLITGEVGLDGVPGAFRELADPDRHCKVLVVP